MIEDFINFQAAVSAVAEAKPLVSAWMKWMMTIPFLGIFFVKNHPTARLAVFLSLIHI